MGKVAMLILGSNRATSNWEHYLYMTHCNTLKICIHDRCCAVSSWFSIQYISTTCGYDMYIYIWQSCKLFTLLLSVCSVFHQKCCPKNVTYHLCDILHSFFWRISFNMQFIFWFFLHLFSCFTMFFMFHTAHIVLCLSAYSKFTTQHTKEKDESRYHQRDVYEI
jgi:hypothetical protein